MCRAKRAFSLAELMMAVGLFVLVLILVFGFFDWASGAFRLATTRQGIQGDATRVMLALQTDLKRTATNSLTIRERTGSVAVDGTLPHRDAVCLGSLQNWTDTTDPNSFDPDTGQPRWNRYIIYYATTDEERGKLVRVVCDPETAPVAPTPLAQFSAGDALVSNDPATNLFEGNQPPFAVLAENVTHFEITETPERQVQADLILREIGGSRPTGRKSEREVFQMVISAFPENTYPPVE